MNAMQTGRRAVHHLLLAACVVTATSVGVIFLPAATAAAACDSTALRGTLSAQPADTALSNQVSFRVADGTTANSYWLAFGDNRYAQIYGDGRTLRHTYATHGERKVYLTILRTGCAPVQRAYQIVADPVTTYAPTLVFHPDEQYFPDSTSDFLDAAVLVHDLPNVDKKLSTKGCQDVVLAAGPDAGLKQVAKTRPNTAVGSTEPLLDPGRLGTRSGSRAYQSTEKMRLPDDVCRSAGRGSYRAYDPGAAKKHGTDSQDDGMVLSQAGAASSVAKGDTSLSTAPLYIDYDPGHYVAYWIFYPTNQWARGIGPAKITERHEGDWEHVVVRLSATKSSLMTEVGYFQHYCPIERHERAEMEDDNQLDSETHPRVFVAKGGHASYSKNWGGVAAACKSFWNGGLDLTGYGRVYRPWRPLPATDITPGLRNARDEDWFGFEGAWGDPQDATLANYGPQGPGGQSAGVPASWTETRVVVYGAGADDPTVDSQPDIEAPTLAKPVAQLTKPTSRYATFSISASDNVGVTQMRVKATGDADWRPWVDYVPNGTVVLPDRLGAFTVWFQVRDAAGNLSSERAADLITRVTDSSPPVITTAAISHPGNDSQYVGFSITATDALSSVTQLRVRVNGDPRPWVPFVAGGTIVLPDGWGTFGIGFDVMDEFGNVSTTYYAGAVHRIAQPSVTLRQIDNNGNLRSCGSTQSNPCSDIVKKLRTTLSAPFVPDTNMLIKAWRLDNGSWLEARSPYFVSTLAGRSVLDFTITDNLRVGIWRFQAQVPVTVASAFTSSDYQYLRID
jgi:hypothetical protein